ncbi:hypothetical protein HK103_002599 [Boothiomyces macroporosus]|uniref:Telomere-associated protein Rif1 N-terminal domain-containing protein n=1 Tax=Boothiomyces macroporosus TaxID=261099 RepID=A0AAD5UCY6_9FUNG|nr:hypothetical protein HK103_002599 [Boothiomyces macroporosus]
MSQMEILKECGQEFLLKPKNINQTLQKIESCFNSQKSQIRQQAFIEWQKLIYMFRNDLNLKKVKLILVPILNCLKFEKNSKVLESAKETLMYLAILGNGLLVYELADGAQELDAILLKLYSDPLTSKKGNELGVEQLGKPYEEIIKVSPKPMSEIEFTKIKYLLEKNKLFPVVINYFSYLWNERKPTTFDLLNMIMVHLDQHFSKENCLTLTSIKIPFKKGNSDLKILRYLTKLVDRLIQMNSFDELVEFSKLLKQEGTGKSPLSLIKRLKNESPLKKQESSPLKKKVNQAPEIDLGNIFEYPESIQAKKTVNINLDEKSNIFDDQTVEKSKVLGNAERAVNNISLPFEDSTKSMTVNGEILGNIQDLSVIFGQDPSTPNIEVDQTQSFHIENSLVTEDAISKKDGIIPAVCQEPSMILPVQSKELYELSTIQPNEFNDQTINLDFEKSIAEKENNHLAETAMLLEPLSTPTVPFQPQADTVTNQAVNQDLETTPINRKDHKRKKRQSTEYISVSTTKPTTIHVNMN